MKKFVLTIGILFLLAGISVADDLGFGVGIRNHNLNLDTSSLSGTNSRSQYLSAYSARLNLFLGPDLGFYGRAELGVISSNSLTIDGTESTIDLTGSSLSLATDFLLGFGFFIVDSSQVDLFFGAGIQIMSDLYRGQITNEDISTFVFGLGADLIFELELSRRVGLFVQGGIGYGALALVFDYYDNLAPMDNIISWGLGLGISVTI